VKISNGKVDRFWSTFGRNQAELAWIRSADDPVYDRILEALQDIDSGLYFEFSNNPGYNTLIITADGNKSLFATVDFIVARAPKMPGWTVFALRPAEGFPESARWENFCIKIENVYFNALERPDSGIDLYYMVPGLDEVNKDNCHRALLVATDHGIGEKRFAETVMGTELVPLPAGADISKYLPLVELEPFLNFREEKLKEKE